MIYGIVHSEVRFVEIMESVCDRSDHDVRALRYCM